LAFFQKKIVLVLIAQNLYLFAILGKENYNAFLPFGCRNFVRSTFKIHELKSW
jgi:hypothetical protein